MQVNRTIVASVARLTPTKLLLAAMFVITRSSFIALFITSEPVYADTLVVGSMYFDSEQTLKEVINLSAQHDNEGIAKLIQDGHISDLTREEKDIVVLISGSTPESPAEFRFLNGPTTFWTLTKNVTTLAKSIPTPTPLPTPLPTPELTPLPTEPPTPTSQQHNGKKENNALMTLTASVFGIRSMANGNGTLLINVMRLAGPPPPALLILALAQAPLLPRPLPALDLPPPR